LHYHRFATAALAIQHVNETLNHRQLLACTLEVGSVRFGGAELRELYLTPLYPFARREIA
jgi:hypothetical protein